MKEIIKVEPLEDYKLLLTFDNGEIKIKDMKPYLDKGVFKKIKDINIFNKVTIKYGTISWEDDIDMCADSLYDTSEKITEWTYLDTTRDHRDVFKLAENI